MTAATMRREEANRNRLGSFESFVVVAQVHLPRTDCYQVIIDDATSDYYCCCAYYRHPVTAAASAVAAVARFISDTT